MSETELTREAYQRLEEEFRDLTTRGRIEVAKAIESARALGDLSENGDYHAAKDTQGKMEARIRQIKAILDNARIVDAPATDVVAVGSVVNLRYEGETETEAFFVGSIEERRPGMTVVSPTSPLGSALLGAKPGDKVSYDSPAGRLTVEVVSLGEA